MNSHNEETLAILALTLWAAGHRDSVHATYDVLKRFGLRINHAHMRSAFSKVAAEARARLEAVEAAGGQS